MASLLQSARQRQALSMFALVLSTTLQASMAFTPQILSHGQGISFRGHLQPNRARSKQVHAVKSTPRFLLSGTRTTGLQMSGAEERSLEGKVVLITGASSGMGLATAIGLLKRRAHVVATCRNEKSCRDTAAELAAACDAVEVPPGDGSPSSFSVMTLDLASLDSVRSFSERFTALYPQLDTLVANAGVMGGPFQKTEDGYESNFQVNYLSHFLLVNLLDQTLSPPPAPSDDSPRVILISSLSSEKASLALDAGVEKAALRGADDFDGMTAYRQSKLAQVLMARELVERKEGVLSCSVHPGVVDTNLFYRSMPPFLKPVMKVLSQLLVMLGKVKTSQQGAETALFLATRSAAAVREGQGQYWADCALREANPEINDASLRKRQWEQSLALVGLAETGR